MNSYPQFLYLHLNTVLAEQSSSLVLFLTCLVFPLPLLPLQIIFTSTVIYRLIHSLFPSLARAKSPSIMSFMVTSSVRHMEHLIIFQIFSIFVVFTESEGITSCSASFFCSVSEIRIKENRSFKLALIC